MQRDQCSAGPVIMYDEIVNPGDITIRENDVINLLHQFRFGRLPQQGLMVSFAATKPE